jgi:membrane associated rhomboid family serine protease
VILDRDGVINEDRDDYIKSADEWVPIPGSLEAIARLGGVMFLAAGAHSLAVNALVAGVFVLVFILLGLIQSALQGIYSAALYRYATVGSAGNGFEATTLEQAFRVKV